MQNEGCSAQAQRLRDEAAELRAAAAQIKNPMTRASFRRMANAYDILAQEVEERATQRDGTRPR
jgi:hypothetical protein